MVVLVVGGWVGVVRVSCFMIVLFCFHCARIPIIMKESTQVSVKVYACSDLVHVQEHLLERYACTIMHHWLVRHIKNININVLHYKLDRCLAFLEDIFTLVVKSRTYGRTCVGFSFSRDQAQLTHDVLPWLNKGDNKKQSRHLHIYCANVQNYRFI